MVEHPRETPDTRRDRVDAEQAVCYDAGSEVAMSSLKVMLVVEVDAAGARVTEVRVEPQEVADSLRGDDVAATSFRDALFSVADVEARIGAAIADFEEGQRAIWDANDAIHELEKQNLREEIERWKAKALQR